MRSFTGKTVLSGDYRVSKSAKFKDEQQYKVLRDVEARIHDMSDLSMRAAEVFQVANYGIGGHYDPHFDHATREVKAFSELNLGNRIATALFYVCKLCHMLKICINSEMKWKLLNDRL